MWLFSGALIVGGILTYEHRAEAAKMLHSSGLLAVFRESDKPKRAAPKAEKRPKASETKTALLTVPTPFRRPTGSLKSDEPAFTGSWFLCASRTDNCIVDSDTFVYQGKKIRIADIDSPGIGQAKCDGELKRGLAAQMRLRELLNQGPFTLSSRPGRDEDGDGRKLRVLMRDGKSVGQQLVGEGLAKRWTGKRQSWCGQA